ncbi:RagB/SusD family nutrient uptake outer membrane protein [Sphingobacterium corticibacterium]|uniref:RagB/SusD family nutrient uptake outer membrane protein n=1 Tax=Sphingobacterium corticibacterium TaxID=2484746 RepID=A0A4Q6XSW5_9SPHI|nr:RagB/SusD family nutrient uptake outer membrane protein [Sphingobacterium corticibacterium]RZF59849.1 RagB/SusD family nutrient uptake outer membrane protein [Sphingobacterium corticibacterium]
MKGLNILTLATITSFILFAGSCNKDFLDKNPPNSVSGEIFWNSQKDVETALAGVYYRLQENFLGYERVYLDALTDNAFADPGNNTQTNLGQMTIGGLSPGLGGALVNLYSTPYRLISSANYFLDNVDRAELDEQAVNVYKAEVRFLRALAYFDLVQSFGGVVVYRNFLSKLEDARIAKSSEEEVYAFIHEDLDFAIEHLPTGLYHGHAVKGSAQGIKARVYMMQQNWPGARQLLEEIIVDNTFSLADNYEDLFTTDGQAKASVSREIMFATQYLAPNSVHRLRPGAGGLDIELGWFALMQPYKNLVDDYEMKDGKRPEESAHYDAENPYQNRDPRLYATVKLPGDVWRNPITGETGEIYNTYTGFHTKKWVDLRRLPFVNETARQSDQDYIHLRYADVLLMYAEVVNELDGPVDAVYNQLNLVRGRTSVGLPNVNRSVYDTKDKIREYIRHERRIEFALEGHRYNDLKRWKIAHTLLPTLKNPSGVSYVFREHNYRLPFSITELDNNPQLEQNDGYK